MSNLDNKALIKNDNFTLVDLITKLDSDSFQIPKFQRNFVWSEQNVLDLGDSLIRGYPISSLLIMPMGGSLNVSYESIQNISKKECVDEDISFYLLDGQQRLTALTKLFIKDQKYEFYFDLLAILIDRYPTDNIGMCSFKKEFSDKHNVINEDLDLCRLFPIAKKGNKQQTRQFDRFMSGKMILNGEFSGVIIDFLENFNDLPKDTKRKYNNYLGSLFGKIPLYHIPYSEIDKNADLGVIVRVFEKVNSTGVKLGMYDLVNAKSFKENDFYKEGLTSFFKKDFETISESLLKNAFDLFFEFKNNEYTKLARIIRIMELRDLNLEKKIPSLTNKKILAKSADHWFKTWLIIRLDFAKIIKKLESDKFIYFIDKTLLEYFISIFLTYPKLIDENIFYNEFKRFILLWSLDDKSFTKSNLDIVERFLSFGEKLLNNGNQLKYSENDIKEFREKFNLKYDINPVAINKNTKPYFTLMHILFTEHGGHLGLFNVDLTNSKINSFYDKNTDEHHLIPLNQIIKNSNDKEIYNSAANLIKIDFVTNRYEIKDKQLVNYLNEIKLKYDSENSFKNILKQNLIPIDYESIFLNEAETQKAQKEFIYKRSRLIADSIKKYFESF